jgi:integrase
MPEEERRKLFKVMGEHRDGFRDLVIVMMAVHCGLRIHEILGLDQEQLFDERGVCRQVVSLRVYKGCRKWRTKAGAKTIRGRRRRGLSQENHRQRIFLGAGLREKLMQLRRNMMHDRLDCFGSSPMFQSRLRRRLSDRSARENFWKWQEKAKLDGRYTFHELRHTAITLAYRLSNRDPVAAATFARHSNLAQIMRYTHVDDSELAKIAGLMPR